MNFTATIAEPLIDRSGLSRGKIYNVVEKAIFAWVFNEYPFMSIHDDGAYSVDYVMSALTLPNSKVAPVKNALMQRAKERERSKGSSSYINGRRVASDMVALYDIAAVGKEFKEKKKKAQEAAKTRIPKVTPEQWKQVLRSRCVEHEIGQQMIWRVQDAEAKYQMLKEAPKYRHVTSAEKEAAREAIENLKRETYAYCQEKGWIVAPSVKTVAMTDINVYSLRKELQGGSTIGEVAPTSVPHIRRAIDAGWLESDGHKRWKLSEIGIRGLAER